MRVLRATLVFLYGVAFSTIAFVALWIGIARTLPVDAAAPELDSGPTAAIVSPAASGQDPAQRVPQQTTSSAPAYALLPDEAPLPVPLPPGWARATWSQQATGSGAAPPAAPGPGPAVPARPPSAPAPMPPGAPRAPVAPAPAAPGPARAPVAPAPAQSGSTPSGPSVAPAPRAKQMAPRPRTRVS